MSTVDEREREVATATRLTLYSDTDALYDDMLEAIGAAHHRVIMETYIFAADRLGWRFARALAERAESGVDVRLLVDTAGALEQPPSTRLRRYLSRAGVKLRWFNRLWRLRPSRLNRRNHRKLLMVDEQTTYVGSSNIDEGNSPALSGEAPIHQLDVRVNGALAHEMCAMAETIWERLASTADGEPLPAVTVGSNRLVPSLPLQKAQPLRALYWAMFEQARERAYLATAYFVPDMATVRLLEATSRRGVDVRLMLPRHTDLTITRYAAHALYWRLLQAGITIYEYQPAILHVKAAVIDSAWCTVGSANFDHRSFFLNHELNLDSRDEAFAQEVEQHFRDDLAACEAIDPEAWARRPWHHRVRERCAWTLRRLL